MNSKKIKFLSRIALALPAVFLSISMSFANSDEDKLKELEKAMRSSAPAEIGSEGKAKKVRTRAIVFDNDSSSAPQAGDAGSVKAAAAGSKDCQSLPPGVEGVAVDFAINFNVGSATIAPSSEATLSQIGKVLALNSSSCIVVEGHTDSSGNADKNMVLSRGRAESVVNFVSSNSGIDRKRLVPLGKGSSDPLKSLSSSDPRNRRVVFKVIGG